MHVCFVSSDSLGNRAWKWYYLGAVEMNKAHQASAIQHPRLLPSMANYCVWWPKKQNTSNYCTSYANCAYLSPSSGKINHQKIPNLNPIEYMNKAQQASAIQHTCLRLLNLWPMIVFNNQKQIHVQLLYKKSCNFFTGIWVLAMVWYDQKIPTSHPKEYIYIYCLITKNKVNLNYSISPFCIGVLEI